MNRQDIIQSIERAPILKDMEYFLGKLGESIPLTENENFKMPFIMDLNIGLTWSKPDSKRILQHQHPEVVLLFHLVRNAGLYQVEGRGKQKAFVPVKEEVDYFQSLNKVEQYFYLIEVYWRECDFEDMDDGMRDPLVQVMEYLLIQYLVREEETPERMNHAHWNDYNLKVLKVHGLAFCVFGWLEDFDPKLFWDTDLRPKIEVNLTALGEAFVEPLVLKRNPVLWNRQEMRETFFEEIPFFAELKKALVLPKENEAYIDAFREVVGEDILQRGFVHKVKEVVANTKGSFDFRVKLGKGLWRDIRLSKKATLHDLACVIIDAYEFDFDHLYAFYMDNKWWSRKKVYNLDEYPFAEDAVLGELELYKGSKFKFLFDFGHEWRFEVAVIGEPSKEEKNRTYSLLASVGKAPEQYGNEGW